MGQEWWPVAVLAIDKTVAASYHLFLPKAKKIVEGVEVDLEEEEDEVQEVVAVGGQESVIYEALSYVCCVRQLANEPIVCWPVVIRSRL